MVLINTNLNPEYFNTSKFGSANIVKDISNVYTISTSSTTSDRQALVETNKLNNLTVGDIIKIKYQADGAGKLSFYLVFFNADNSTPTLRSYSIDLNGKYNGEVTFVAEKSGAYKITMGCGWNTNYDGTLKNIDVNVQSNSASGTATNTNTPLFQRFVLQSTAQGTFTIRTDLSTHAGTLSVSDDTLILTLNTPFSYRFTGFTQGNYEYSSKNYVMRIDCDTKSRANIRFFNAVDNTPVAIANVAANVFFGLLLV